MYNYKQIERLISQYTVLENSNVVQTSEGVLGCGNWICEAPSKKTAIIKEVYVNSWNSTHIVKFYNKTPKKYSNFIN